MEAMGSLPVNYTFYFGGDHSKSKAFYISEVSHLVVTAAT